MFGTPWTDWITTIYEPIDVGVNNNEQSKKLTDLRGGIFPIIFFLKYAES